MRMLSQIEGVNYQFDVSDSHTLPHSVGHNTENDNDLAKKFIMREHILMDLTIRLNLTRISSQSLNLRVQYERTAHFRWHKISCSLSSSSNK